MPVGKGEEDKSLWKRGWFWETLDVWGQLFKNHDLNFLFESFMTILKQEAKCCLHEYIKWLYIQLQRQPEGWLTGLPFPWRMEWSSRWVCGAGGVVHLHQAFRRRKFWWRMEPPARASCRQADLTSSESSSAQPPQGGQCQCNEGESWMKRRHLAQNIRIPTFETLKSKTLALRCLEKFSSWGLFFSCPSYIWD